MGQRYGFLSKLPSVIQDVVQHFISTSEIKALNPSETVRIEYHDNPGLRYGNADIVLDYIVRRPDTGGSFGLDMAQGINALWGKYNVRGNHITHDENQSVT